MGVILLAHTAPVPTLPPQGQMSWQEPALVQASHGSPSGIHLLWHGVFHWCRRISVLLHGFSWAAGESLFWHMENLLPLLLTLMFLYMFSLLFLDEVVVYPFPHPPSSIFSTLLPRGTTLLMALARSGSTLDPHWYQLCRTWRKASGSILQNLLP